MHSKHTIRSETAKLRRKSWTDVFWPRRRKFEITATTIPLPRSPMIKIVPVEALCRIFIYFSLRKRVVSQGVIGIEDLICGYDYQVFVLIFTKFIVSFIVSSTGNSKPGANRRYITGSCCVHLQVVQTGLKLYATTPSNRHQHATECANGRNM